MTASKNPAHRQKVITAGIRIEKETKSKCKTKSHRTAPAKGPRHKSDVRMSALEAGHSQYSSSPRKTGYGRDDQVCSESERRLFQMLSFGHPHPAASHQKGRPKRGQRMNQFRILVASHASAANACFGLSGEGINTTRPMASMQPCTTGREDESFTNGNARMRVCTPKPCEEQEYTSSPESGRDSSPHSRWTRGPDLATRQMKTGGV